MESLIDRFGRRIDYLRLSATDWCNLRCVYCLPERGVTFLPRSEVLRFEEIRDIVRAGLSLGITKVRLTGGEPLVRDGLEELVAMLSALPGLDELALTTNGVLLARAASVLARAGLRRVNISLDTLRPDRFTQITRFGTLEDVLAGIAAAGEAGLRPIKLNVVVMRGVNDDEIVDLGRLAYEQPLHVRFIELMPIGGYFTPEKLVPSSEILARLETLGPLTAVEGPVSVGPARSWSWKGACGTIGIIGAVTQMFCAQCNRLRLTANGQLRPCLDQELAVDLKPAVRPVVDEERLRALFQAVVTVKPKEHCMVGRDAGHLRYCMAGVGG